MKAIADGNESLFEDHMKKAVELEEETNFPAGPPRITKPSYEQYGEWLLEKGDYAKANELFDKALLRMPRRSKSLLGKMTAFTALNQGDEAEKVQDELESIFDNADAEVKSLLGE